MGEVERASLLNALVVGEVGVDDLKLDFLSGEDCAAVLSNVGLEVDSNEGVDLDPSEVEDPTVVGGSIESIGTVGVGEVLGYLEVKDPSEEADALEVRE